MMIIPCFLLLLLPVMVSAECGCDDSSSGERGNPEAHILKLIAVCSILAAGALGVLLPIVGKRIPSLSPERNIFLLIKAFAAGVILATGFIHVLPDAFENLTSPCLVGGPWRDFPFTGLIAMAAAIATLMIETLATSYYKRAHFAQGGGKALGDEEAQGGHVHVHTHASHGHAHVSAVVPEDLGSQDLVTSVHDRVLRHRIVTQVLELGIVVHSVIIGVSLGASENPNTIKPLVAALSFHQLFEGMGLGGCISQAKFKSKSIAVMVLFFSLTTPLGIVMGMGISNRYRESSPSAVAVEGSLNAASSGILIYMALVDLLAPDFMSPKMTNNLMLQIGANISLLLGSACMSLLAIWA